LVQTLLALALFVQLAKTVKFAGFVVDPSLTRAEGAWLVLPSLAVTLAGTLHTTALGAVATLALSAIVALLWLDAVLFRVFTIELGPGGVADVVLSVLYRELAELSYARRFFAAHRCFALLPVAVALSLADAALGLGGPGHRTVLVAATAMLASAALA